MLVNEKNGIIAEHENNPKSMQRPMGVRLAESNIIHIPIALCYSWLKIYLYDAVPLALSCQAFFQKEY